MRDTTVDIPIEAGKRIAEEYGYDQVVIVARKVGGREHVTTYGVDKGHCGVAARMGGFFKHKLMGWPKPDDQPEIERLTACLDKALTVCRCAVRVIESSAYQGVSDEDCDLENAVKNWQLRADDLAVSGKSPGSTGGGAV